MSKEKMVALICPIAFLLFGIWIRISTLSFSSTRDSRFPNLAAYLIIIMSVVQLVSDLRKNNHKQIFKDCNLIMILEYLLLLCLYIFLLKKIGFVLDTLILTMGTMLLLGYRRYKIMIPTSIGITLAVFGIFYGLLRVPLPTLIL